MPKKEDCLKINFNEFIEKLNNLSAKQLHKLDTLLSKIEEHAYDAYEYIIEPPNISAAKVAPILNDLATLLIQTNAIMDVLSEIDYDSEYMDRTKDILGTMEDEIPELIEKLS